MCWSGRIRELLFYRIHPVNVAVLPASVMEVKTAALANALVAVPSVEIVCLNSSESFEDNKAYLIERIRQEKNPVVQKLCEQDIQYLVDIQRDMARRGNSMSSCVAAGGEQNDARRLEKVLKEQGFEAEAATLDDLRRLLAVYYTQQPIGSLDSIDGERWVAGV